MKVAFKIIGLLCLISLFSACKKEFTDEFDPIMGKWKWYRTVKNVKNILNGTVAYTEPYTYASNSVDQYEIEFKKKGLVLMYKNGKIENKYKVKHSHGSHTNFTYLGDVWNYEIEFKKDKNMVVKYYTESDTLVLFHFPNSTSDKDDFFYTNHFVRE